MSRNTCRLASCSNQGGRPRNDDSAFAATVLNGGGERVDLICVADGVGGSSRGDLASRLAVQGIREFVESSRFQSLRELKILLPEFLNGLSAKIAQSVDAGQTANTTLTACLIFGGESLFIHSGDSMLCRCMVEKTDFTTLTDVHSCKSDCVNENADEDAGQDISPSAISAALGSGFTSVRYQVGENFLVSDAECWIVAMTDGVHGAVSRAAMVKLCASAETPEALAQRLVQAALDAGTRDNATVAVYRAGPLRRPRHLAKAVALSGAVVLGGTTLLWLGVHAGSRVDPAPPQEPMQASTPQVASTPKMKLDEALASARKAKDEKRWADCLEYANAALMLVPSHDEALALKREAEERLAEEKRKAEDAAEEGRLAEEKRKAAEAARPKEEKPKADEAAETARLAEERRKAEAEKARLAEEKRKADEVAESARLAETAWNQAKQKYESSGKEWGIVEDLYLAFQTSADSMKETGNRPSEIDWLITEVSAAGTRWIQSAHDSRNEELVKQHQTDLKTILGKIEQVNKDSSETNRQTEGR